MQIPSSMYIKEKILINTPGTRGGPGGCDRTLAVKRRKKHLKISFFLHTSSYAISGETNFQPREIPGNGSKAKDGKEREKKKTESM